MSAEGEAQQSCFLTERRKRVTKATTTARPIARQQREAIVGSMRLDTFLFDVVRRGCIGGTRADAALVHERQAHLPAVSCTASVATPLLDGSLTGEPSLAYVG